MSLEHFKTQVLLLHSEQSTLDSLSAGFNDRYTVHCATSGSEALNTLGETQIDVIVSAQDLPGMSGLEALREAKKRYPETIGILLADDDDDVEAVVGDQEVFQVVRGNVTPQSLKSMIDGATRQARLLALAESANDMSANPDEPMGEHIIMETSENGSTIISDGTGRMPALDPAKISARVDLGASSVDVLVLTQDEEFLQTVRESARGLHHIVTANTPKQADDAVRKHKIGVAVIDAAMAGTDVEELTLHLRSVSPRLVPIVAGRRDDGEMLMDLINRGKVYRFLLKPVSPGRSRLAIEASVRHHLEAPDSAFEKGGKPAPAPQLFTAAPKPEPKAAPKPEPKATPKPEPRPEPRAAAKLAPKPEPKAAPKPEPRPVPKPEAKTKPREAPKPASKPEPKPAPKKSERIEPKIESRPADKTAAAKSAKPAQPKPAPDAPAAIVARREEALSPIDDGLGDAFGDDKSLTETVTGLVRSVSRSIRPKKDAPAAEAAVDTPPGPPAADAGGISFSNPRVLGIGAVAVAAIAGVAFWLVTGSDEPGPASDPGSRTPSITEAEPVFESEPEVVGPDIDALLEDAREAADAGRIIDPAGDNAIELYVAARKTVPGDPTIEAELAMVINEALGIAETAILEREIDTAAAALARVEFADPGHTRLPFLGAQLSQLQLRDYLDGARAAIREGRFEDAGTAIDAARRLPVDADAEIESLAADLSAALSDQRVDEVLASAAARLEEGALIAPPNDNARYYYELALSNSPGNTAARQGLATIASKLILQAREAIDETRFDDADDLIAEARRLDPSSNEVTAAANALRDAIARQQEERRLAAERAAAEKVAAERAAAERAAAEKAAREKAAAERAAAEKAAAERAAAERAAARRAAAQRAAAEKLSVEGLATTPAPRPAPEPPAQRTAPTPAPVRTEPVATTTTQQQESRPEPRPAEPQTQPQALAANTPSAASGGGPAAGQAATPTRNQDPIAASTLKRTKYVAPRYPRSAQRRGLSGWVDVVFTVDIDGTVSEVDVLTSEPDDTFVDAATRAVAQWEYEPVIEYGVAVQKRAAVRMMFALE